MFLLLKRRTEFLANRRATLSRNDIAKSTVALFLSSITGPRGKRSTWRLFSQQLDVEKRVKASETVAWLRGTLLDSFPLIFTRRWTKLLRRTLLNSDGLKCIASKIEYDRSYLCNILRNKLINSLILVKVKNKF